MTEEIGTERRIPKKRDKHNKEEIAVLCRYDVKAIIKAEMKIKGEDNIVKEEVTCFLQSVLKNASHFSHFIERWQTM